jgi:hypothetical protein
VPVLTLDRSKPFGTVSPPWSGERGEFDRPAHYGQNGRLFDRDGLEIVPGRPLKRKPSAAPPRLELAPNGQAAPSDADAIMSPGELLARADELPLSKLRQRAGVILGKSGETCPSTRAEIVAPLEVVLDQGRRSHE